MVGGKMDMAINEVGVATGDEKLAPNNRMCVMFGQQIVAEVDEGDGKKFVLFNWDRKALSYQRPCSTEEAALIKNGIDEGIFERFESNQKRRGSTVTFITL